MATATSSEKRTAVRGLGEIALRVNDLDAMQKFYEEVIGLPLMTRVPNCAFFKIADGYGGHTQVLALFDRSGSPRYSAPDAKPQPSTTSRSRYRLLISRANRKGCGQVDLRLRPPSTHGCIGDPFM